MSLFTKITAPVGPNILQYPDCTTIHMVLDFTSADDGCIKGGTPINAKGQPANDATAIGILRRNAYDHDQEIPEIIIEGRVRLDVIEINTGLTISDAAKSALPFIGFFDGNGFIPLPSAGGSGGPSSMIILDVYENYSDTEGNLSTYALNINFADLSQQLIAKTTTPAFAVSHNQYGEEASTYPVHIQFYNDQKEGIMLTYFDEVRNNNISVILFNDDTIIRPPAG